MLLTIDVIKQRLDEQFLPLEPMLSGFRLVPASQSSQELQQCESQLQVRFPEPFRRIVLTYDFGRFTVGPTAFWSMGDYFGHLVKINRDMQFTWWGRTAQPTSLVLIAGGDFWAILLNVDTGEVVAFPAEKSWEQAQVIGRDFEMFLRGIGTAYFRRLEKDDRKELARDIAKESGGLDGLDFWTELTA